MLKLISDHMEDGFLDNIIDMFKHDKDLFMLIGDLLKDERSRVRIGTVALVETFCTEDPGSLLSAIPGITKLLKDNNPTIRGDAAHVLGIIGNRDAIPFLEDISDDESEVVRESVQEALKEIAENNS